jgi:tripartite-type tricarboxylate transporter receptor subunit TctC
VNDALKSDDVIAPLRNQGIDPTGGSPEDFARYVADDIGKWTAVAKAAGMRK